MQRDAAKAMRMAIEPESIWWSTAFDAAGRRSPLRLHNEPAFTIALHAILQERLSCTATLTCWPHYSKKRDARRQTRSAQLHLAPARIALAKLLAERLFEHESFISYGVSPYVRSGPLHPA